MASWLKLPVELVPNVFARYLGAGFGPSISFSQTSRRRRANQAKLSEEVQAGAVAGACHLVLRNGRRVFAHAKGAAKLGRTSKAKAGLNGGGDNLVVPAVLEIC